MLNDDDTFSYNEIMKDPKADRERTVDGVVYHVLHNNGWLRVCTTKGRVYHLLQAQHYYQLPDWKLHISVQESDLPRAWDIVADHFMKMKCNTTMKMKVADYDKNDWPEKMHGREITVYIYRHKLHYEHETSYAFSRADQYTREFWLGFINSLERELRQNNIASRGTARGDKRICQYISLRNEAYTPLKPEWNDVSPNQIIEFNNTKYCYPPNIAGYNAAGNKDPLMTNFQRFFHQRATIKQKWERKQVRRVLETEGLSYR